MALEAELIDDKIQIFKRPATVREITKGRNSFLEIKSFEDIAPVLEERKSNQVAIIHPNIEIIPKDQYGGDIFYSAQNFRKRGPLIELNTFKGNQRNLMENQWSPIKARIEASKLEKYQNSKEHYVGWLWFDPEQRAHIVHPTEVIEGHRIHIYALKSPSIDKKIEIRKGYSASDSNLRTLRVNVPSRSEKKHEILLEHITDLNDKDRFVEWTRLKTRHRCKHKEEDFSFRFKDYETYCPHDVAAYAAYSRNVAEEKKRIVFQPFPLFRESTLRLYLSLIYDTMKIDISTKNGKIKTKQRPLNLAEINPILMHTWLRYGNYNTFYVPTPTKGYKRMRDYNWSNSSDGIKFKVD